MNKDTKPQVKHFQTYIEDKDIKKIRILFKKYHIVDIVELVIEKLSILEAASLIRMLETEDAADIFGNLNFALSEKLIKEFKGSEIQNFLTQLDADEIIDIIDEWPENISKRIIDSATNATRKEINILLRYDENEIGHHMSLDNIVLKKSMTVKTAISFIKKRQKNCPIDRLPYTYFVETSNGEMAGFVDYESLLLENSSTSIEKIIKPAVFVNTKDDREKAIEHFKKYELNTLAVINSQNKLVGTIDSQAILEAMDDEHSTDIDKLSGVFVRDEVERNYLTTPVMSIVKSRAIWLVSLLFIGTLTQLLIQVFIEDVWGVGGDVGISAAGTAVLTAIAVVPILIDSGGNAGGQASGTMIRSLALKDVKPKDWKLVLGKEMKIAVVIGLMMFAGNFVRMIMLDLITYSGYTKLPNDTTVGNIMMINLITSIAIFLAMIIAQGLGSMAPLWARAMGWDEASISSPLITTILDLLIVFIYFGIMTIYIIILPSASSPSEVTSVFNISCIPEFIYYN